MNSSSSEVQRSSLNKFSLDSSSSVCLSLSRLAWVQCIWHLNGFVKGLCLSVSSETMVSVDPLLLSKDWRAVVWGVLLVCRLHRSLHFPLFFRVSTRVYSFASLFRSSETRVLEFCWLSRLSMLVNKHFSSVSRSHLKFSEKLSLSCKREKRCLNCYPCLSSNNDSFDVSCVLFRRKDDEEAKSDYHFEWSFWCRMLESKVVQEWMVKTENPSKSVKQV